MTYTLGERSRRNLEGVHPTLVKVAERAIQLSPQDFTIIEGVRTLEKQREYYNKGASKTMKSKHLIQADGFGHAIDVYPYYDGKVQVNAPFSKFKEVAQAFLKAAGELGVNLTWGADWNQNGRTDDERFIDSPHFQVNL